MLSNNDTENTVIIECFGDYLRAEYKFEQCVLLAHTEADIHHKVAEAQKSKEKFNKKEFIRAFKVMKIVSLSELKKENT